MEDSTQAKCLYDFSTIPQHELLVGFFILVQPKIGNFASSFVSALQPSSLSLQEQKHFQVCVAAVGCPSTFPTCTVSLIEQIARDRKSLLISLSLKTSGCFWRCHTLKMLSGMQEAASGPGAEPRAQRHPERETQLTCSASPKSISGRKEVKNKNKKKIPHYSVSNKLRNFFDFHDVHMAVNFHVIL